MRSPRRLFNELGPGGFLTFQLVVGGSVLAALIHPISPCEPALCARGRNADSAYQRRWRRRAHVAVLDHARGRISDHHRPRCARPGAPRIALGGLGTGVRSRALALAVDRGVACALSARTQSPWLGKTEQRARPHLALPDVQRSHARRRVPRRRRPQKPPLQMAAEWRSKRAYHFARTSSKRTVLSNSPTVSRPDCGSYWLWPGLRR